MNQVRLRPWARVPVIIAIGFPLGLFILAVGLLPEWWVTQMPGDPADRVAAVGGVRQTILFLGGGSIALLGVYFSHKRHQIDKRTTQLLQDSNYTDRYTEAITQLGSESLTIRLGGVYALERVAKDSRGDRETVQDVLAAFIRSDASRATAQLAYLDRDPSDDEEFELPLDVAAAMTVLSRRPETRSSDRPRIDLSGTRLNGFSFPGASLQDVQFSNASLVDVQLSNADLEGVNLDNAELAHASMPGTNFRRANFNGARLNYANLSGSDLSSAFMDGVALSRANLKSANLTFANLTYADLDNADLTGADLKDTVMRRARLNGTVLAGVHNWSGKEFESALSWDLETEWPEGFEPSVPTKERRPLT